MANTGARRLVATMMALMITTICTGCTGTISVDATDVVDAVRSGAVENGVKATGKAIKDSGITKEDIGNGLSWLSEFGVKQISDAAKIVTDEQNGG